LFSFKSYTNSSVDEPEVSGGFGIQYLFDFEAGAKQEEHGVRGNELYTIGK
jgi:hypothetical protein